MKTHPEAAANRGAYTVHVVPHTHWDREWYLSFQQFRIRLVRLVDTIIRLLREEGYPSYHFDGQTIVLEDYLEIKPDQRDTLRELISSGKLDVGPWYVMPDEFLVSGESLIRNLMLGRRIARSFGRGIDVGYLPDIFGHISQMPQILKGVGIDNVVFWRGISGDPEILKSEFYWRGADGTIVFAHLLPAHAGYSNALNLPRERDALVQRVRDELTVVREYASTKQLLFMNGTDHTVPEERLPEMIAWMNEAFPEGEFVPSTVENYARAVQSEAGELQTVSGELRDTNRAALGHHNFVLPNVLSSRMYLKLANEEAQTGLERWAEPWSVWASCLGYEYPKELLLQSWKYLLQNHPHDSICGCSVDEVHDLNEERFAWSRDISGQLTYEALRTIALRADTSGIAGDAIPLHVFNASVFPAGGVVEAEVLFPELSDWRDLQVIGPKGDLLSSVVLERRKRAVARHSYDHHPVVPYWQTAKLRIYVPKVPGSGYATIGVFPCHRRTVWEDGLVTQPGVMENEWLRLEVNAGGTLTLTDKNTGVTFSGLHRFEDGGDRGDGYTYSPPMRDEVFYTDGSPFRFSVAANTRDFATFRLEWRWELPEGLSADRRSRSERFEPIRISTEVTLTRDARRVEFRTVIDNRVRDHRLRVLFPTGLGADASRAGAQFDIVERGIRIPQPAPETWIEEAPATLPMHGFVDISGAGAGLAFLSGGLKEYELLSDDKRTLAITLLRAVGHLGSPDPLTIHAGAGPALETPGSQCLRTLEYRYALFPHGGSGELLRVAEEAELHRLPLKAHQGEAGRAGILPPAGSFLRLSGDGVHLSALKGSESGGSYIVRLHNLADAPRVAELRFASSVLEAYETDLEERRTTAIRAEANGLRLEFGPKQIKTVELRFNKLADGFAPIGEN